MHRGARESSPDGSGLVHFGPVLQALLEFRMDQILILVHEMLSHEPVIIIIHFVYLGHGRALLTRHMRIVYIWKSHHFFEGVRRPQHVLYRHFRAMDAMLSPYMVLLSDHYRLRNSYFFSTFGVLAFLIRARN